MSVVTQLCPIPGCAGRCGEDEVMCKHHWFRVPAAVRAEVWREYRRARGSVDHLRAIRVAIAAAVSEHWGKG